MRMVTARTVALLEPRRPACGRSDSGRRPRLETKQNTTTEQPYNNKDGQRGLGCRERPLLQAVTLMAHTLLLVRWSALVPPCVRTFSSAEFSPRGRVPLGITRGGDAGATGVLTCCPRLYTRGKADLDAMRALAQLIGFGDQAAQFGRPVGLTNTTDPSGLLFKQLSTAPQRG